MIGLGTLSELRVALLGILLAAVFGWAVYENHHLIAEGKAQELSALKASSDKLLAQAQKDIATETKQHAADVAANQVKLDEALKSNGILSDSLDQRVRDFNAYRAKHPDLPRPASGPSASGSGECGAQSCGDLASTALQDSDRLARSVGELSALLKGSQRDRDSLTGLPR